jgi:hypothetical protein
VHNNTKTKREQSGRRKKRKKGVQNAKAERQCERERDGETESFKENSLEQEQTEAYS